MAEITIRIQISENIQQTDKYELTTKQANDIAKKLCSHFKVPDVKVVILEELDWNMLRERNLKHGNFGYMGLYYYLVSEIELIKNKQGNTLNVLLHELAHHLSYYMYAPESVNCSSHGYFFQLAKKRITTWTKNEYGKAIHIT